jgi:catechol 2,3-dioxygenase-like lactoylglutathione lyase family enzyme
MSPSAVKRPDAPTGLRHLALRVRNLEACERFYTALLGLRVEWRPDPDNLYLTGGGDNLALHRVRETPAADAAQRLDHLGFLVARPEQVDEWFAFLKEQRVPIVKEPRTHRDGARSFYCLDPDGNCVQMLYHPPIAGTTAP